MSTENLAMGHAIADELKSMPWADQMTVLISAIVTSSIIEADKHNVPPEEILKKVAEIMSNRIPQAPIKSFRESIRAVQAFNR